MTEPLTQKELAEIKARADAATPGPWRWNSYSGIMATVPHGHPLEVDADDVDSVGFVAWIDGGPRQHGHGDELHAPEARANARFVEHSREDIPRLLATIEAAHEIAKQVVAKGVYFLLTNGRRCYFCEAETDQYIGEPPHKDTCIVTHAQAFMEKHP